MSAFDWRSFCSQYSVHFVTSGPNTARGHISVNCPFCGKSDPSQHMGLSLSKREPVWGCLRNSGHRGRNPRRLVQKLLGCTFEEAQRIVDVQQSASNEGDLEASIARLQESAELEQEAPARIRKALAWPKEFREVVPSVNSYSKKFLAYVQSRGFSEEDAVEVCGRYLLHYSLTGDQAWRLIFPIFNFASSYLHGEQELAGWTGRDIRDGAWLRYRTSVDLPNEVVYNSHLAFNSMNRTLVIVEGPVDAVKMDYYGAKQGVSAVATLGTALPAERKAALAMLIPKFNRVFCLFDEETLAVATELVGELSEIARQEVKLWQPPAGKDAGAMSPVHIEEYLRSHLQ